MPIHRRLRHGAMFPTFGRFVDWWFGELSVIFSSRRPRSSFPPRLLLVAFHTSRAIVFYRSRGVVRRLGEVPLDARGALSFRALRSVAGRRLNRSIPFALSVASYAVLEDNLTLPDLPSADLHDLLAHQIDRLTPYDRKQVYFCWDLLGRDATPGRIRVRLTVVPRSAVDRILGAFEDSERSPDYLAVMEQEGEIRTLLLLDPEAGFARGSRVLVFQVIAAALLAGVVIGWPILERSANERELRERVEALRPEALAVAELRSEATQLAARASALARVQRQSPRLSVILRDITERFPDHAWVQEFNFSGTEVSLIGEARHAADLLATLEESPILRGARFRAPVTRAARTEKERFRISVEVSSKEVP